MSRLPAEPKPNDPDAMQVMLRLPSGHRLERWFNTSDPLQVFYLNLAIFFVQCYNSIEGCLCVCIILFGTRQGTNKVPKLMDRITTFLFLFVCSPRQCMTLPIPTRVGSFQ